MKSLKDDNKRTEAEFKDIRKRLEAIEAPPQTGASESIEERNTQHSDTSDHDDHDNDGIFEWSESESEVDIEAESMGYSVKTGPKIGSKVAQFLNNEIVNQGDMTKIQKFREEYCKT